MNQSVTTVISKFFSTLWLADRWKSEQNVSEKLKTDFEKTVCVPQKKEEDKGFMFMGFLRTCENLKQKCEFVKVLICTFIDT